MRPRTALANVGGPVAVEGDPEIADVLRRALGAQDEATADELTHGFHAYPARMHPAVARTLLASLPARVPWVLDPFCGSGTVLVESLVAGRPSVGVDLSPLALRLSEVKTARRDAASRARFLATVAAVAEASEERVRSRTPVRAPVSPAEARWWQPHVLKELGGLHAEIASVEHVADRRALEVLLSAIVVKFSRQRADTAEEVVDKRLRKGLPTEFFRRKGEELVRRWAELDARAPAGATLPRLLLGDARELPRVLGKTPRAGLVLSSPPYGGTYDYERHHARRYPWLGIDPRALERGEIGARRNLARGPDAVARWDEEVSAVLAAIARVVVKDALVVLLVGDAQIGGRRMDAPKQLGRLGREVGLAPIALASQHRPDWRGGPPRQEHLAALRAG